METFRSYFSYVYADFDQYLYNAKYADYLSPAGNLAVAAPSENVAIIIWPHLFTGYTLGIQITTDSTADIVLNDSLEPVDPEFSDLITAHRDQIDVLLDKAEQWWEIDIDGD